MKQPIWLWLLMIFLLFTGCRNLEDSDSGSNPKIGLELIADGFTAPLVLTPLNDGSGQFFVADQDGRVWILTPEGKRLDQPFLDLRDRMIELRISYDERGLLGFAPHPNFQANGRVFVYYSAPLQANAPEDWDHTSHISEFNRSDKNPSIADPDSERILMRVDQPQSNHNGGQIIFGPDGYLYIPLGDGGGANDIGTGHPPLGNAQDINTLLGSILRIDVDNDNPYTIPEDNPFIGISGRDEIWSYGFRNPFRISFDSEKTRDLYVGDVGQDLYEEVDIVFPRLNYGWNIREGFHCFDPELPTSPPDECPKTGLNNGELQDPILEYEHDTGLAVIGGYVYRGKDIPELDGHYIFGDWSTSFISAEGKVFDGLPPTTPQATWIMRTFTIGSSDQGKLGAYLLSFGQDVEGEIYVLTSRRPGPFGSTGQIYKIVPAVLTE